MNQLNSPQMAPEAILATLEERQNRVIEEDRIWNARIGGCALDETDYLNSAGQTDQRRINLQAEDEYAIQQLHYAEAQTNPHLYQFSVREQMLAPNPDTVTTGINEIDLDDTWFTGPDGGDIRTLAGRDLRYWLLRHLDRYSNTTHKTSDLVAAIGNAGFKTPGRASKTVSDALHTETDRGRITRTGWGRYQITRPLAPTSRRRINRRIENLRQTLSRTIAKVGDRIETLWTRTLRGTSHRVWGRELPSLLGYFTTANIRIRCTKVANPTDKNKNTPPPAGQAQMGTLKGINGRWV